MSADLEGASYIVWVDYGPEGWRPKPFDTEEDVIRAIQSGTEFLGRFVVTGAVVPLLLAPPE